MDTFIFILLYFAVFNYFFLLPLLLNLFCFWRIFFSFNYKLAGYKNNWDNLISRKLFIFKQNTFFFFKISIILNIFYFIFLITLNGYTASFWWSHFKINNFFIYLNMILLLINMYFMYIVSIYTKQQNCYNIDYIFSIINITTLLSYLFYSNTFFTFFFLLELISCLILYKFITTKINFSKKYNFSKNFSIFSKNFINLLFFQYWSSFFSSVLLIYSICFLQAAFNTSEWVFLNIFIYNYKNNFYLTSFIFMVLILGLVIKLGIAPVHLYKIEIYKGIPFLTIFFYTVYYFLVFFLLFIFFYCYYLSSFIQVSWIILICIILFGSLYVFILLFDVNLFKAFLAYSTILNSILFIIYTLITLF